MDSDAQSVRMFVADGGECLVAQSYAKNLGLYGERVGALSIVSLKYNDIINRFDFVVITRFIKFFNIKKKCHMQSPPIFLVW